MDLGKQTGKKFVRSVASIQSKVPVFIRAWPLMFFALLSIWKLVSLLPNIHWPVLLELALSLVVIIMLYHNYRYGFRAALVLLLFYGLSIVPSGPVAIGNTLYVSELRLSILGFFGVGFNIYAIILSILLVAFNLRESKILIENIVANN